MKIDRRSFIAMGIGAAAGTALSPLPWKLTDDISIWTQNWPWTPVPANGPVTIENSICTLCPGGCGISVRKVGDRVVKIEGTPNHPVNAGGICAIGLSGPQVLYGPSRVKSPMKREGSREDGKWKPISWDDAIAEVVSKLGALTKEGKQEGLACISGSARGTVPELFKKLLGAIGSPNFMTTPTMADTHHVLFRKMHGLNIDSDMGYDIENADFILSFGSGIIEGWGSPVRMIRAQSGWKTKKAKVIQADQRLSNSAASASTVIAVKPGTEADLALGLAAVIIDEGLYEKGFVSLYSRGFSEFAAILKQKYTLQKVSETTGIQPQQISDLARQFAASGTTSVALCGRGKGLTTGTMREFMAVHALNALVGRINTKGGVWAMPELNYVTWADSGKDSGKSRIDKAGITPYPYATSLLNRLPGEIMKDGKNPVDVLLVHQANPVYTLKGSKQVMDAFKKIPFIVSFSTYMDETAAMADLILPNHSYLERYEDVPVTAGLTKPTVGLTRPVIKPVYDTRNTGDVVISIAKAMAGDVAAAFPWKDYQTCLEEGLGDKWSTLKEKCVWTDNGYSPKPWGAAFGGGAGKFLFPLEIPEMPALSGDEKKFPLILLPKESLRLASSDTADAPFAMKIVPSEELSKNMTVVEINPATGKAMGLGNMEEAVLTTPEGKATVKVAFFDGIMPGVIAMQKGLGHTAYSGFLKGKGVNYNELVEPVEDPVSGQDGSWGSRAAIQRA